ncbi:uncharacterized protein BJ212DRAFT_1298669 [Suillus subaureus]|uniref:Uncharacterized protein n=1 Tax=Suillus subaureus TaxID=48587 RepID=A0A9P7EE73_9AGAM|nr:uncharacterized protein BJ212DRAFT_1298669 [Suillus subaureus]KAG1818595.1 hypothetical protein BJ212DRAFT_1298669 [Suillus subaureus]
MSSVHTEISTGTKDTLALNLLSKNPNGGDASHIIDSQMESFISSDEEQQSTIKGSLPTNAATASTNTVTVAVDAADGYAEVDAPVAVGSILNVHMGMYFNVPVDDKPGGLKDWGVLWMGVSRALFVKVASMDDGIDVVKSVIEAGVTVRCSDYEPMFVLNNMRSKTIIPLPNINILEYLDNMILTSCVGVTACHPISFTISVETSYVLVPNDWLIFNSLTLKQRVTTQGTIYKYSPEQIAFMQTYHERFLQCKVNKNYEPFWSPFFKEWSKTIKALPHHHKCLEEKFCNDLAVHTVTVNKMLGHIMKKGSSKKNSWVLKPWEMYSKIHYHNKVKDAVVAKQGSSSKPARGSALRITTQQTKQAFEEESEEVREKVFAAMEEMKKKKCAEIQEAKEQN